VRPSIPAFGNCLAGLWSGSHAAARRADEAASSSTTDEEPSIWEKAQ
jgi:hypothetical protein